MHRDKDRGAAMRQEPNVHGDVTLHRGGAELIDRQDALWLALHAHHPSIKQRFAYFPDEGSWELYRSGQRRWTLKDGAFILLAERHGHAVGYAFVETHAGHDDTWVTSTRIAELQPPSVA
ncbi:hypothetical protein ACFXPY_26530 [Streptomyces sp. NPDC059153]|uniref:hypothetical protein n=1 Tax=unclassified Streptomyces TaxID=2593676 RepID=UPI00367985BB